MRKIAIEIDRFVVGARIPASRNWPIKINLGLS